MKAMISSAEMIRYMGWVPLVMLFSHHTANPLLLLIMFAIVPGKDMKL